MRAAKQKRAFRLLSLFTPPSWTCKGVHLVHIYIAPKGATRRLVVFVSGVPVLAPLGSHFNHLNLMYLLQQIKCYLSSIFLEFARAFWLPTQNCFQVVLFAIKWNYVVNLRLLPLGVTTPLLAFYVLIITLAVCLVKHFFKKFPDLLCSIGQQLDFRFIWLNPLNLPPTSFTLIPLGKVDTHLVHFLIICVDSLAISNHLGPFRSGACSPFLYVLIIAHWLNFVNPYIQFFFVGSYCH